MSLSKEEQEILQQMEAQFDKHEARLVSRLGSHRVLGSTLCWAIALFVAGLALAVGCFTTALPLAILGVAMIFTAPCMWCRPLQRN